MSTSHDPCEPFVEELDDGQAGLLAAARLIFTAAGEAERMTASHPVDADLDHRLVEADLKVLLWQAVALLPPGLQLHAEKSGHDHKAGQEHDLRWGDLLSRLEAAARELGRVSLRAQPDVGISTLLADLTALITRFGPSSRDQDNGRKPE